MPVPIPTTTYIVRQLLPASSSGMLSDANIECYYQLCDARHFVLREPYLAASSLSGLILALLSDVRTICAIHAARDHALRRCSSHEQKEQR